MMNNETDNASNFEQKCKKVLASVLMITIQESVWESFGYKKMPDRGAWFDIFVPKKKLELERVLSRELWLASFAMIMNWCLAKKKSDFRKNFTAMAMDYFLGKSNRYDFCSSLDFDTPDSMFNFLINGSYQYGPKNSNDFGCLFINRCEEQLSQDIPGVWLFGVGNLFLENGIFRLFIQQINQLEIEANLGEELNVEDEWYLKALDELLWEIEIRRD